MTWECQTQLYRNDKESGDDIRLSVRLFSKCNNDYKKFCKDVEPGHMRVQVGGRVVGLGPLEQRLFKPSFDVMTQSSYG